LPSTVDQFTEQINRFNTTLDTVTAELNVVLATANDTLISIERLADETTVVVARGEGTLDPSTRSSAPRALHRRGPDRDDQRACRRQRPNFARNCRALGTDAAALIATLRGNRLHRDRPPAGGGTDADRANTLLAHARYDRHRGRRGGGAVDTLIAEEGAPLLAEIAGGVADATQAIALVTEAAETDLPVMIADIRTP
jgi:phospholipid/cholesterol/gamma-HCH transport system substrate-binding protein